jgi:hypothetical protein
MLVIKEIEIAERTYIQTYSDAGFYIECDGALYEEAIDVAARNYTETDILIEGAASDEDYVAALAQLGVSE